MIRFDQVWAIASAEARLTRRLARFWVFLVGAALLSGAFLSIYLFYHYWSHASATAALINPRFLLGAIGGFFLFGYSLAVVFLAYEVRARDQRERIVEPLDAKPVSNLELMLGRLIGILIPSWVGVATIVLGYSLISALVDSAFEPLSLALYLTLAAIPCLVFMTALTFLVSVAVRSRALAAVVLLVLLGGMFSLLFGLIPLRMAEVTFFDVPSFFTLGFGSDVVRWQANGSAIAHRLGVLLLGAGLLLLAAAFHPRRDDGSRALRTAAGLGCFVVGLGLMSGQVFQARGILSRVATWRAAHQAHAADRLPDLRTLDAQVSIDPGGAVALEARLTIASSDDQPLQEALFALNPGYTLEAVDGGAGPASFENGLLRVPLAPPLAPGDERSLTIRASGVPETEFAYLDGVRHPLSEPSSNGQIFLLGFEPSINRSGFVALMPGSYWLPGSGPGLSVSGPQRRLSDPYRLTLQATVPSGWLAAGPGRREGSGGSFSWKPNAPVDGVALIAAPFQSATLDVDQVRFELLLAPAHANQLETLASARDELAKQIREKFTAWRDLGLSYPYDGLTLVEAPSSLRAFGGGWRQESTLGPAGIVLLRESGFPTARFDVAVEAADEAKDQEDGAPKALVGFLQRFFALDFAGGNLFSLVARQLVTGQVGPTGRDGVVLDALLNNLTGRLANGAPGFFSAHIYDKEIGNTIGGTFGAFFGGGESSLADAVLKVSTSRPQVWGLLGSTGLSAIEPKDDPRRAYDALTLKTNGMALSLLEDLGKNRTGALLAAVLAARAGQPVTRDDLIAAARASGQEIGPLLETWIDQTGLAGFVAGPASAARLPDGEGGVARYQVSFTLRNEEPVPGVAAIGCVSKTKRENPPPGEDAEETSVDSFDGGGVVRLAGRSAARVGCITPGPPLEVRINPYLSLNRERFTLPVPAVDEKSNPELTPLNGVEPLPFDPSPDGAVLVDDLDPGFSASPDPVKKLLRFGRKLDPEQFDQGLFSARVIWEVPQAWSRLADSTAAGRYRHGVAVTPPGDGTRPARFIGRIPTSGRWTLEFHFPARTRYTFGPQMADAFGDWALSVEQGALKRELVFQAKVAERGWNTLGAFDLQPGDVTVTLSDKAEGRWVIADAVRWVPAAAAP